MKFRVITAALLMVAVSVATAFAADPTATEYSMAQCEGSLTPYPTDVRNVQTPDSLVPVYLSHVGRHGARYPASAANTLKMRDALLRADSVGTITPLGRDLLKLCGQVICVSTNRWGALDSLGMSEQRAIASRMLGCYPELFTNGTVNAISSYSPRAMMSMYSFVHQLDRLNNKLEFITSTGRMNSTLMRPFDFDEYKDWRNAGYWREPYDEYFRQRCPVTAITRVLGRDFPFGDTDAARDLAITEYYVLAGLQAMEMPSQMSKYFNEAEANALWSCFNLRQYLQRTASTVQDGSVPADIAGQLLLDIITKAEQALAGQNPAVVDLRFGHAETLMPLLSLMRLPGCRYLTNYFDTVGANWRDWQVVPMAANLQIILFREKKSGRIYCRTDLNERPITLIAGDKRMYIPWAEVRNHLMNLVPMHLTVD